MSEDSLEIYLYNLRDLPRLERDLILELNKLAKRWPGHWQLFACDGNVLIIDRRCNKIIGKVYGFDNKIKV